MATNGCGCKICKADLGEYTNNLISSGESPKSVLDILQSKGVKVTEKLLKRHLSAYSIEYPDEINDEILECVPIKVDLNKIDFSEYNFEPDNIESIIGYLQKINLKIYLNQSKITLQAQQDVIDGKSPNLPRDVLQNLAIAFQILDKSTGLSTHINQQEAIKIVESMALTIQQHSYLLSLKNAQNQTEREAN